MSIGAFACCLSGFAIAVAAGQRGGAGFFDNLWLTGPMLAAYAAAVVAAVAGLAAIIRHRERAALVVLAVMVGAPVTLFGLLEIAFPH
ncbi:MAG: hypothetical protein AAGA99_13125 [Actinomycetota bacterium]